MELSIGAWLPVAAPIIANWIVIGVVAFIAYRAYSHITRQIFAEVVDEAVKKLDDRTKVLNSLRNLHKE